MPLNTTVGETALPLDPTLISGRAAALEQNQIRWAADPLLQKLTDFLEAVLNSELQDALDEVKGDQPDTMQVVVKRAIPAAPEKFINNITREKLPILCVYRAEGTWNPDSLDEKEKVTVWRAEYVMPELEAFEVGSLLGFENAVIDTMAVALKVGSHSAYNSSENIAANLARDIEPGAFEFANWQVIERDQAVMFPAVRLAFTTYEDLTPNENGGAAEPLETISTDINLPAEDETQDSIALINTEVELFAVESITTSGTTLSVTFSRNFSETALPNIGAWQLIGTESVVTAYGAHAQPTLKLTIDQALEAAEVGVAKLRLVLWGQPITSADGLASISEIEPTTIEAP